MSYCVFSEFYFTLKIVWLLFFVFISVEEITSPSFCTDVLATNWILIWWLLSCAN